MRTRFIGAAVVAACACAALLLGVSSGTQASAGSSEEGTVHVIEHALTDTVVYVGDHTDHTGNLLTFHNPVFNTANSRQVGSDRGDCIRIDPTHGTWECRWTTFLDGGQITVEGPFNDTSNTVFSITGGTGIFREARGQMILRSRNGGAEYDFIFQLGS
jgi:hypothetical protein